MIFKNPSAVDKFVDRGLFGLILLLTLLFSVLALGYDGRRLAQQFILGMLPIISLLLPVNNRAIAKVRDLIAVVILLLFFLDSLIRMVLEWKYASAPDSADVLAAIANTNQSEVLEYASLRFAEGVGLFLVFLTLTLVLYCLINFLVDSRLYAESKSLRRFKWFILILAILTIVAHASKPWRRFHPVVFWYQWVVQVQGVRAGWGKMEEIRQEKFDFARELGPKSDEETPSTVVLVLTDSVNRRNMGLYGYARDTTPKLDEALRVLRGSMVVFRDAWSTEFSTIPSLERLFGFGEPGSSSLHLLALARAAGFHVWWMSNHDDLAIKQSHAKFANELDFINRAPGRSSLSLDEELLDCLKEALQSNQKKKLIVVHLMGVHPHYELRQPDSWNPFAEQGDAVDQALTKADRSLWVRHARRQYDEAMHYHDTVVAESLWLTVKHGLGSQTAWMYVSDHGQNVGHGVNAVGHSPNTYDGYAIPAIIWRRGALDPSVKTRSFRLDWSAWTVLDLMGVDMIGYQSNKNILSMEYSWIRPEFPSVLK